LTAVSLIKTVEAKVAARIAVSVAIPMNALAGGTAAKEKSITVATINTKLFGFFIVAPPIL